MNKPEQNNASIRIPISRGPRIGPPQPAPVPRHRNGSPELARPHTPHRRRQHHHTAASQHPRAMRLFQTKLILGKIGKMRGYREPRASQAAPPLVSGPSLRLILKALDPRILHPPASVRAKAKTNNFQTKLIMGSIGKIGKQRRPNSTISQPRRSAAQRACPRRSSAARIRASRHEPTNPAEPWTPRSKWSTFE